MKLDCRGCKSEWKIKQIGWVVNKGWLLQYRQSLPRGWCGVRGFILKSKDLIKLIYAHGYKVKSERASLVAQLVKNPPAIQDTWVRSRGWEDPVEKEKATHSSIHCTIKLLMNNRNPQLQSPSITVSFSTTFKSFSCLIWHLCSCL